MNGDTNFHQEEHGEDNKSDNDAQQRQLYIVDISGFENDVHKNSLEQLLINYTYEKVTQFYITKVQQFEINKHQEDLEKYLDHEKINSYHVHYQQIFDLLDKQYMSIFSLLNQSNVLLQTKTMSNIIQSYNMMNNELLDLLYQKFQSHAHFLCGEVDHSSSWVKELQEENKKKKKDQKKKQHYFTIKHYYHQVTYDITNFIEKNHNDINVYSFNILSKTTCTLLTTLLNEKNLQKKKKINPIHLFQNNIYHN